MLDSLILNTPRGAVKPGAYVARYIFPCKRLTHGQGLALKRLLAGLREAGATFKSGKPIRDRADAVAWLLEQLEEGGDDGSQSNLQ